MRSSDTIRSVQISTSSNEQGGGVVGGGDKQQQIIKSQQQKTQQNDKLLMAEELQEQYLMLSQMMHTLNQQEKMKQYLGEAYGSLQLEKQGLIVKQDINLSNLQMKNKLLQQALTKRNKDYQMLEENNKQLIFLLQKYDHKLTEMQEDIDIRQMKIKQYQQQKQGQFHKIHASTLQQRIRFLVGLLQKYRIKLQQIQVQEQQSRSSQQVEKLKSNSQPNMNNKNRRQQILDLNYSPGNQVNNLFHQTKINFHDEKSQNQNSSTANEQIVIKGDNYENFVVNKDRNYFSKRNNNREEQDDSEQIQSSSNVTGTDQDVGMATMKLPVQSQEYSSSQETQGKKSS